MDYYKFQNIQADTQMRQGIVKPTDKAKISDNPKK